MIDQSKVNFYIGEVIDSPNTYKQENGDFTINVITKQNVTKKVIENVKPANINVKQIPIKGETVLIFQGYDSTTSFINRNYQWYYLSLISIQSNINNNILPIISNEFKKDDEFVDVLSSTIQPFKGDLLFEGRYRNTIRIGSTNINSSNYSIQPPWSGDNQTDPIIVISNGHINSEPKKFTIENINEDASSLYLTSTQRLNNLKLHNTLNYSDNTSTAFSKSQFVGVADRIILKSKTDVVALDSNLAIELNSPLLVIGNKSNSEKEYGLHSTPVKELFWLFFNLLSTGGLLDSNNMPICINPSNAFVDKYLDLIDKIDNIKIRQDKGEN